jgi:hypothetical protein
MTLGEIDIWQILDIPVLLLIGMGPKVALVPFLDLTVVSSCVCERRMLYS